ncbi:MAG: DUF4350 domain-containing protein [Coriobacteriia bacterium]|nr:DUF4350 domain-containing protein [Coriobacteriia bacterium]
MSKKSLALLISIPVVLAIAVLGYAIYVSVQIRTGGYAEKPAEDSSTATTLPMNPSAPMIVAETLEPTGSRSKRGTIVFDMSHNEVFGPQDASELGQSKAVERMRNAGYAVKVITKPIDKKTLSEDVAAVFLPGPMVPLSDEERTVLDDFVGRGGTMIMTIHVPFPVMGTPARYGLPVGTGVMVDPRLDGNQGYWATDKVIADPVTEGVKMLSVASGWPVGLEKSDIADPRIIIEAPAEVVVDQNNDQKFDKKDPQPPYGVVGVATIGSGRVVVLGDDAIFANIAIDTNDNARLLDNLLELIAAPKPA